jgi:FkbM family methyltransferase
MRNAQDMLSGVMLRYAGPLSALRRLPVVGGLVHRVSHRVLPADTLVWKQIQGGAAQGLWICINPRTSQHYYAGTLEPPVQQFLSAHLNPGDVFYDVGANIGFYSLIAARQVGVAGKVFSFEPDAELAARLRENAARNGFSNVNVIEAAVWSAPGTAFFSRADPHSSPERGQGHIEARGDEAKDTVPVRLVALDQFLAQAPPPQVIKCDTEGAEVDVFRGAHDLLAKHRPAIACEFHSPENQEALDQMLADVGYAVSRLDQNHLAAEDRKDEFESD